ncbi:MAG: hypothetical protein IMZ44_00585 [Planctomycetes bacterium]|nr:hypothetical protein [Planctomycetota bacterium]
MTKAKNRLLPASACVGLLVAFAGGGWYAWYTVATRPAVRAIPSASTYISTPPLQDPDQSAGRQSFFLAECDQSEAQIFLVAELDFPHIVGHRLYTFPMKWKSRGQGAFLPSLSYGMENADGQTPDGRGIGYGLGVNLVRSTEKDVTIKIFCYWTASDGSTGSFDRKVVVPVRESVEVVPHEGAHLRASWRQGPREIENDPWFKSRNQDTP